MPIREISAVGVGLATAALILLAFGVSLPGFQGDTAARGSSAASETELGANVYRTNCAACHGPSGEGQPDWQQRGANGVLPQPPHDSSGHTWHHADGLLFRLIRDGGAQFAGPTTPSGMPAFGEVLSDEETRAVVNYLKSFWGADERAFQTQVSESDPLP